MIRIFADGACSGNPGPGGWAAIILDGRKRRTLRGGEAKTTNNRMELLGAISALESLKKKTPSADQGIIVLMDSQYVVRGMNDWIVRWEEQGWRTKNRELVKHKDLWQRLLAASKDRKVSWQWVRGHAGLRENEEADRMAREEIENYRSGGRREMVLDVKTTGSYKSDRIVEIGMVEIRNGIIKEVFHQYINPHMPISPEATKVHGITDDMVRDQPGFGEVVDLLMELTRDARLIVHNASFGAYYIDFELVLLAEKGRREGNRMADLCGELVDVSAMAEQKFPEQSRSLDALTAEFGIEAADRTDRRGALTDANLVAEVYLAMRS